MKIIGGTLKGRNFYMPGQIRPTKNMSRRAVFDLIGHDLADLSFLDLFAGSGAMGLEAFSRGARPVTMVERETQCLEVLNENLQILGLREAEERDEIELLQLDVFAAIKLLFREGRKFDIVFLDPPYELELAKKTLKTLGACDILQPNCTVIIETGKRESLSEAEGRFKQIRYRKYGKSFLAIYEGS